MTRGVLPERKGMVGLRLVVKFCSAAVIGGDEEIARLAANMI
jgi:hypothetical protein